MRESPASKVHESELDQLCREGFAPTISACRDGDRDAQRQLYELCHQRIYRMIVRMVGVQEAPDVTQNVFLQLSRKIDQFAGRAKFDTWLYRLALNEALQFLRKRRRWRFHALLHEPVDHGRGENELSEAGEVLELALSRLDPDLRSVFLLRESEGLSYCEIAEVAQIPEGTVGSRLNRARRELQKHLTELGWEPEDELP